VGSVFGPIRFLLPVCWLLIFILGRQTGKRNLTGSKTPPTIWHTYMKLVTKYQIPVINSCLEKCAEKCAYTNIHIEHICTFFVTFFSATIDCRDLIFGHKLHIGTPYRGKCFLTLNVTQTFCPLSDDFKLVVVVIVICEVENTIVLKHCYVHNQY
jgi:hypothetical protein